MRAPLPRITEGTYSSMRSARVIPVLALASCAILATACGGDSEQNARPSPSTAQVGEAVRGDTPEIEVGYSRDFASQGLAIELEAQGGFSPQDQPLLCFDIKNPNLEKKLVRFEVDLYEDVPRDRGDPRRLRRSGGVHRYPDPGGGLPLVRGRDQPGSSAHDAARARCPVRRAGHGVVGEEAVALRRVPLHESHVHRTHRPGPAVRPAHLPAQGEDRVRAGRGGPLRGRGRRRAGRVLADRDAPADRGDGRPGRSRQGPAGPGALPGDR